MKAVELTVRVPQLKVLPSLAFLLPLLCLQLQSQPIQDYYVLGTSFFSQERLKNIVDPLQEDSARVVLAELYASEGFWNVRVSLRNDTIFVEEGEQFRIDSFQIIYDTEDLNKFTELSKIYENSLKGKIYSDSLVQSVLRAILQQVNQQGYALARIELAIPEVKNEEQSANLKATVIPGLLVRVSDVRVEGNNKTSSSLILRAINLEAGTIFTDQLVDDIILRLQNLDVFEQVDKPVLYKDDSSRFGLLIRVTEGSTNTFDGVLGYQPATELDDNGFFTGLVRIVLRNMFGAGERLSGRWERSDKTRSLLELGYSQPLVFGLPLEVSFRFNQLQEAETPGLTAWVDRSFQTNLGWSVGSNFSVTTGGTIASIIPSPDTLLGPCSNRRLLSSRTLALTLGGQFDGRDNQLNPRTGAFLGASYTFGAKSINDPEECLDEALQASQARRTVNATIETYLSVAAPVVIAGTANFSDVDGDLLEESELLRFGGINSVRGYRDGQFRASRSGWGRLEGRLLLSPVSFTSLFIDGGYYSRPDDSRLGIIETEDVIYGYGVGLQIDTPIGIARFAFALGKEDAFEDGKVSVGIVGDF